MKKLISFLHTYNEKLGQYFSSTALGQILIAIILAAAVAYASSIAEGIKAEYAERDFYNELTIGISREYIEDSIGHPKTIDNIDEKGLTACHYLLKHSMIRTFYDDDRLIAYFVSSKDKDYKKICISDKQISQGKPLGSYTYKELDTVPEGIQSFQVRDEFVYLERYLSWEEVSDVYYFVYFGDYGFKKNTYTTEDEFWNDEELTEIDQDQVQLNSYGVEGDLLFMDRAKSFPNTYGACDVHYMDAIEEACLYSESF